MNQGIAKVGHDNQRATQALIIFTKVPIAGQVKTRLIPSLSPTKAAELQKCFLQDILDLASNVKNCDVVVAYTPQDQLTLIRGMVGTTKTKFIPQRGRDIGERMHNAFKDVFKIGHRRVVLIGTDLPSLPLRYLDKAFDLLQSCDTVLGLNADGGYYLIGMQSLNKEIFEGIDWGTDRELPQTLLKIHRKELNLACLDVWYDVDTFEDLKFLRTHLEYLKECDEKIPQRTYRYVKRLKL